MCIEENWAQKSVFIVCCGVCVCVCVTVCVCVYCVLCVCVCVCGWVSKRVKLDLQTGSETEMEKVW